MSPTSSPTRMDTDDLALLCQQESSKFFRDQPYEEQFCFELFRRALALNNQFAWEALYQTYGKLVRGWIRKCGGFDTLNMPLEELETLSFEKFWQATGERERFERFTSLRGILQYLRTCCASTVTDALRRRRMEHLLTDLDDAPHLASGHKPDVALLSQEQRYHFWQEVRALLNDTQEEIVVQYYFVLGFKPRQIQARFPEHFPGIQDVYRVKRNVMSRLRRSEVLQTFQQE